MKNNTINSINKEEMINLMAILIFIILKRAKIEPIDVVNDMMSEDFIKYIDNFIATMSYLSNLRN